MMGGSLDPPLYSKNPHTSRRACEKLGKQGGGNPLPPPQKLPVAKQSPAKRAGGQSLQDLGMVQLPVRGDGTPVHWDAPLLEAWDMSESAAQATLDEFASVGAWICNILGGGGGV